MFARRAVKSIASRGLVGKLQYAYTGPWRVTKALDGASYEIQHLRQPNRTDKKHASDLSPYPVELIAFEPLDGADNRYGQLYKPISATRFDDAGLKGFLPSNSFRLHDEDVPSNYLMSQERFKWPTLSELNDELDKELWVSDQDTKLYRKEEREHDVALAFTASNAQLQDKPGTSLGPPLAAPITCKPAIPTWPH